MKYIRMKDGNVYEIVGKSGLGYFVSCPKPDYTNVMNIRSDDIEKEADSIEELCDELVVIVEKDDGSPYTFVADSKRIATWNASLGAKVYGANWTDKGLIYVAKMNEKGDLELL